MGYPRASLISDQNHKIKTTIDTESILHLYEDTGTKLIDKLEGMYAFAFADGENHFITGNPIGIKPLYYTKAKIAFSFASVLKPLAEISSEVHEFPPDTYYHSEQEFK